MRKITALSLSIVFLSGCATTYDPAEVCSASWVQPRAVKAVNEIVKDTNGAVKSIRKTADSYADGKTPGPLQMFSLSRSFEKLEKELTRGRGVKDLKILADTCDNPDIITDGMTDYVQGLGLPEKLTSFIKALPKYREIVESHLQDIEQAN